MTCRPDRLAGRQANTNFNGRMKKISNAMKIESGRVASNTVEPVVFMVIYLFRFSTCFILIALNWIGKYFFFTKHVDQIFEKG